jgi:hypothetical protein
MRPLTKEEILQVFSEKERRKLKLPDLEKIDWENLDFLGWIHPSGHLGYVVYEFPSGLRGIVLECSTNVFGQGIRMCSWCYTLNIASRVRLFTYRVPNTNRTIGDYLCADLECSLYLRNLKKPLTQMQETLTMNDKIKRCKKNIEKFFAIIDEISSSFK